MKKSRWTIFYSLFFVLIFVTPAAAKHSQSKTFKYLEKTFNLHDKKLRDLMIIELEHYLQIFPKSKHARPVQYMLGNIYEDMGEENYAVASYLKMIFLYPKSTKRKESIEPLKKLIAEEKSYAEKREWLLGRIKKSYVKSYSAKGYFRYLETLIELDHRKLYEWTMDSCREFIRAFPNDKKTSRVSVWLADLYVKEKNYREADSSYVKFTIVYPKSLLMPEVLYKYGTLKYEKLKEYEKAIELLGKIVKKYPKSKFADDALMLSGEIREKKLKDHKGAIADYRKLADKYSKSKNAVEALWRIAEINSKLKSYLASISAYEEIVKKYKKNEKGIEALEEAAHLYYSKRKDYLSAAKSYARIAEIYPDYKKAPHRLMEAASIFEKKLKDSEKAVTYYKKVIAKFPAHKKAKDAAKRIEKIHKRKK